MNGKGHTHGVCWTGPEVEEITVTESGSAGGRLGGGDGDAKVTKEFTEGAK